MAGTVEHPDIRHVVYPVRLDGTPTGDEPRLRHDPDCRHFEWGDGTVLGTPELATEEQDADSTCLQDLYRDSSWTAWRQPPGWEGRPDR